MNKDEARFQRMIDRLLKTRGRYFQGINLRCRNCGEQAFAVSLNIAKTLGGWSELTKGRGAHYLGLCIDCTPHDERKSP